MIIAAQEFQRLAGFGIVSGLLVFARVGAAMVTMPGYAQGFVPVRVRLAVAFAFSGAIFPAVADKLPAPEDALDGAAMFAVELLCGSALGMFLRLMMLALEIAGMMIAQSVSLAQMFGGADSEPMPAVSHFLLMAGLAFAAMLGLHLRVAEALVLSYDAWPAGGVPDAAALEAWGLNGVVVAFSLAFSLAAPFLVLATLYNFALGAINRAMPQLMVMMVGAPAVTGALLLLLGLLAPGLLSVWHGSFAAVLADPFLAAP
ncbi:MAG TPA: flagellar biosynthetic protein FliR [Albidovulum sp.]|uniref:flagellar biosynthetic protein FliR n=1 Tax=Albidovulum sp. TaxID=1872424 RepID=UPI001D749704|nr:flagellar biosynthetic protein FliR [Paracoccaceae bacterium]MCB2120782.1 flagellar biosynthetic protein FliR [Paracoccaceae bacterium]MCO5125790.1 flagellar biosynthetic protein FliR [Paracoccaceae bacterium]HRV62098.1 flagellar biosynthetic protein FliR [Albidovulum sp.]